jgi:peroxiredoxin
MKWRSLQESSVAVDSQLLRDQLAARKESISKYVPADVQAIHQRTITTLKAKGLAANALAAGTRAPLFTLDDHNGKRVSSSDLLAAGQLVLCFIRGRWCPFDVAQMEAMSALAEQIKAAGASIMAISPQTGKQSYFMHDQHKLRFPLLVDAHNAIARQFGLVYRVPEEQQAIYQSTFVNLPFVNGEDSWELPIAATYVIGRDGTILFAEANEDYTSRPEPLDILSRLEGQSGAPQDSRIAH